MKEINLPKLIDDSIMEDQLSFYKLYQHEPESDNRFFVSKSDFECPLERYLSITMPKPPSIETTKVYMIGSYLHYIIQNHIKKIYPESLIEHKIENEYTINGTTIKFYGRIDAIIDNIPIEIKSFNDSYGIRYIPNKIHESQLQLYMDMLNVDHGYLLYAGKTNFNIYQFKVDKNEDLINTIIDKNIKLKQNLINHIPPEPNPCWMCKNKNKIYCNYYDECKSGQY